MKLKMSLFEKGSEVASKVVTDVEDPDDLVTSFELWMGAICVDHIVVDSDFEINFTFSD